MVVVVDERDERGVDWRKKIVVQAVEVEPMIALRMVPPLDVMVVETWLLLLLEQ